MKATTIVVGFIVSLIIATGFSSMILDLGNNYNSNIDRTDVELLGNVSDWYNFSTKAAQKMQEHTEVAEEGVSGLSTLEKVGIAFQVLWDAVKFMPRAISEAAGIYNIPDWLMYGGMAILLLVFLVAVGTLIAGILRGVT